MAKKQKNIVLPKIGDYSIEATKKAVLRATLQHPVSLYPVGAGILSLIAGAPFLVGVILFAIGVGAWVFNFLLRNNMFANQYIDSLNQAHEEYKKATLAQVGTDLVKSKETKGAEKYALQGINQYEKINDKFNNIKTLLGEKLNKHEITYGRYLGSAEQAYFCVLDNLKDIVTMLKSINAIDNDYINDRLKALEQLKEKAQADIEEVKTLKKRLSLQNEQLEQINVLLTKNEEAMTSIDVTTTSIASMKTTQGRATVDMESARKQLEDLAKRAHEYSS